ncbi:MAG: FAD-dependent oxidoreductase [Acidobacteriota bacterium]
MTPLTPTEGGHRWDVAIVGAGFAGSILARALASRGRSVLLLERARHPRFALGESTTPLANLSLERLAARHGCPDLDELASWGRWTSRRSDLRCGLKRGFTFLHHRPGEPWRRGDGRLEIAASPNEHVADTHWLRTDIDLDLVRRAAAAGVRVCEGHAVREIELRSNAVVLRGDRAGGSWHASVRLVVDATGGALASHLGAGSGAIGGAEHRAVLAAHLTEPPLLENATDGAFVDDGDYPAERAAVHHLIADGWVWQLRFDHGPASVGLVLDRRRLDAATLAWAARDPQGVAEDRLGRYPTLARQFLAPEAAPVEPWRFIAQIGRRAAMAVGRRWLLLPHAYAFFDPMFSTGIGWSLRGVERLAELLGDGPAEALDEATESEAARRYGALLAREADHLRSLVDLAWATFDHREGFAAVASLYTVAAAWCESQERLCPTAADPWRGFLGADDAVLQSLVSEAADRVARGDLDPLRPWLMQAAASRDLVGLDRCPQPHRLPVDLDVLIERSHLLGLDDAAIRAALPRLRGQTPAIVAKRESSVSPGP